MTDREMLEWAAKAAGYEIIEWLDDERVICRDGERTFIWAPRVDDGDALRLAVRLQIQITPGTYNKDEFSAFHAGLCEAHEFRHYLQDERAATRRAITRAAAEIGKQMGRAD